LLEFQPGRRVKADHSTILSNELDHVLYIFSLFSE